MFGFLVDFEVYIMKRFNASKIGIFIGALNNSPFSIRTIQN